MNLLHRVGRAKDVRRRLSQEFTHPDVTCHRAVDDGRILCDA